MKYLEDASVKQTYIFRREIVSRDQSWRNILNTWRRVGVKLLKNLGKREDVFFISRRRIYETILNDNNADETSPKPPS